MVSNLAAAASVNATHPGASLVTSVGHPWSPNVTAAAAAASRMWAAGASSVAGGNPVAGSVGVAEDRSASSRWLLGNGAAGVATPVSAAPGNTATPLLYPGANQAGAMFGLDAHQLFSTFEYQHAAAVAAAAAAANSTSAVDDVTASGGGVSSGLELPSAKRRRFDAPAGTPLYYSASAAAYH